MKLITRSDIENVLLNWQNNSMTDREVHEYGESLYTGSVEFEDWDKNDDLSVTNEILAELGMLNMNLRTKGDVPILLKCLNTPVGQEARAISEMHEELDKIDLAQRAKALQLDPLYGPFCTSA